MEKIVIIDDSKMNLQTLTDILSKDYNVIPAKTGSSGIAKILNYKPSLILLDIIMPVLNGFEVLDTLKSMEETKDIPVIFITGISDSETEAKCLMLGAVDYITKPFNPQVVMARVNTHIQLYTYRKTIENLLSIDALTGIHNRRSYDDYIQSEWKRSIALGFPLSFAILDIDYFKKHNDTYGHLMGDNTLHTIASFLNEQSEKCDFYLARYGGEEFVMIFSNTNRAEALKITDHIRTKIQDLKIENKSSPVCEFITVSIGGNTIYPKPPDCIEHFIQSADKMLYLAKEQGRNQVVWYPPLMKRERR